MKFAKHLQREAVPEWRKAYMNYKQGKKYLKAIEAAIEQLEEKEDQDRGNAKLRRALSIDTEAVSSVARPALAHPSTYPVSPTGTTPIIKQGGGGLKNYDTIRRLPARSASEPVGGSSPDSAFVDTVQRPSNSLDAQDAQHKLLYRPSDDTLADRPGLHRRESLVAQLGEAARNQGHNVLKSLSRSFTGPLEYRARPRAIYCMLLRSFIRLESLFIENEMIHPELLNWVL